MKKLVLILLLIIIVPIVGVFTFLKLADLNAYKPQIENIVRKYANLDVKINGNLDVAISLKPTIEIDDVLISNIDSSQKIAQIGEALIQFSILPLFHKEIVIDSVETSNTKIYTDDENFVVINELIANMESYDAPINIDFATSVSGINIDGAAVLSSLKSIQNSNFNDVDIKTNINVQGYEIEYNGTVNDLQNKVRAQGNYIFAYKNNEVVGQINADTKGKVPYVNVSAKTENINAFDFASNTKPSYNIGNLFISSAQAEDYIPNTTIPYDYLKMFDADITLDVRNLRANPEVDVKNLKADVSLKNGVLKANIKNADTQGINVNGYISIDSPKSLPYIKLNIKGNTIDLNKFMQNNQSQSKKNSSNLNFLINEAQASQLMDNVSIPYQYLKAANADVNINIGKLLAPSDIELNDINANINLKNSVFKSNINNITAGGGKISGYITLNGSQKSLAVNLTGTNVVLQKLMKAYAQPDNTTLYIQDGGNMSFEIKVNTVGANTDQYLANMNGQIVSYMDESKMKIKSLQNLRGNIIMQILDTLKLNVTKNDLKLKCAVVRGDINSGKVNFPKGIVFDAKDFYLVANGTLNLKNDKLNMEIQPFSGKIKDTNISSLLGSLLKVEGTVNSPKIGINQVQTAKSIIGAVATAGMYNIGDMMLSADSSPCYTALIGTTYANHFPKDTSVSGSVSRGYNNTQDSVKQLGKDIKNQAKEIKNQTKDIIKGIFKK